MRRETFQIPKFLGLEWDSPSSFACLALALLRHSNGEFRIPNININIDFKFAALPLAISGHLIARAVSRVRSSEEESPSGRLTF